jgi:molybdate transport system substrate-binding protein
VRRLPIVFFASLLALQLAACGAQAATQSAPGQAPIAAPGEEPAPDARTLHVFAAASLTDAFEEIAPAFEAANPGADVIYNFAGSQQLAAQIGEGAPADVFASANRSQIEAAITSTRVVSGTQQPFVRNRLVVITPADNPAGITTLQDLAKPGLKLILADVAVPVGQYSLDFLARASELPEYTAQFSPTVLANVVSFEDNVRSVLTKIALGEGDAGIVYSTDAALDAANIAQIAIPDNLNTIASYPIAPIADSENPDLAQAFIDYVLGPEGQEILEQYGFISAVDSGSATAPAVMDH